MKRCARCREVLARDKFYNRSDQPGKLTSYCKACIVARNKERYAADPAASSERQKYHIRKHRYGMSPEEYDARFDEQDGRCAICRRESDGQGGLHVDHDHATGRIRGLLCASCNMGLGQFKDSDDTLMAAITYLHQGFIPASRCS